MLKMPLSSNMAGKSHISYIGNSIAIFDYPRVRNASYTKILRQMRPLWWNVLYSALHPLLNIGSLGRRLNKVQGCPMVPLRLATSMDLSENKHLVGGWPTIRKNMSSSMGRMTSHIIQMFETTNQFLLFIILPCFPAIHAINWRHWNPIRHQFPWQVSVNCMMCSEAFTASFTTSASWPPRAALR